jgi:hypothetical protein
MSLEIPEGKLSVVSPNDGIDLNEQRMKQENYFFDIFKLAWHRRGTILDLAL